MFTARGADLLGKGGTGGSDSHSVEGIGSSVTVFDNPIKDREDLLSNLMGGPFYVGQGLNKNALKRFPWPYKEEVRNALGYKFWLASSISTFQNNWNNDLHIGVFQYFKALK